MNILIVGGTFDENGGKQSSVINKIADNTVSFSPDIKLDCFNGGYYEKLKELIETTPSYDIVFWFANVSNDLEKIRNIKEIAPKVMLVTSKRNDNGKYATGDIVGRALSSKSNLIFEFSKNTETLLFNIRILDPLGCMWYNGTDISVATSKAMERLVFLRSVTRQSTTKSPIDKKILLESVPPQDKFIGIIQDYAAEIQKNMPEIRTDRFVGNASMKLKPPVSRCGKTMPSFKSDGMVFVSRRNVPKQFITMQDFVPVYMNKNKLLYCGEDKPSVDTPVQIRLYSALPKIKYMIHTHCYVSNAPFTEHAVPCGAIEEVTEILTLINEQYKSTDLENYALNLKGHGSIVMSSTLEGLYGHKFTTRPFPENMES